jgi:hypothetical protein
MSEPGLEGVGLTAPLLCLGSRHMGKKSDAAFHGPRVSQLLCGSLQRESPEPRMSQMGKFRHSAMCSMSGLPESGRWAG